jgi:hypothetical protein
MRTIHDRRTLGWPRRPGRRPVAVAGLLLAAGLLAGSATVATSGPAAADTPALQAPVLTPPGCQYNVPDGEPFTTVYGIVRATGVPAPTLSLLGAPEWMALGAEQTTSVGSTYETAAMIIYAPPDPAVPDPAVPGEYTFAVKASNSQGDVFDPINVVAGTENHQPTFISAPAAIAAVGLPFSFQLTAVGCPPPTSYIISGDDNSTRSWLKVNENTGVLSGTPAAADVGTHTFTFTTGSFAEGSGASQEFSLRVSATWPATPLAPAIGNAVPFPHKARVEFTPPTDDGGAPVTSYTVTATDHTTPANGGQTATGTTSPITVTGLTTGDHYTFTVAATNTAGTGDESAPSNDVVPFTFTPMPSIASVTPGPGQATVNINPQVNFTDGPILSYTVTATDETTPANGGQTATGPASPITVTGLTNGDSYTFTVTAFDNFSDNTSAPSGPVIPFGVPGAPAAASATPDAGQATVDFTPPADDGGSPVTGYTVTATDQTTQANGGQTATGPASPITVTGLTNGDSYTFTVTATNAAGTGAESAPSDPVTPFTVPGTPAVFLVTPGTGQATVEFTPPADDGGSPVTGYAVTATDLTTPANGGQTATGTASPITVTGLTNGDNYTFTVTATNAAGSGGSSPSTPASTAAPIPPGNPSADLSVTVSPHPSAADGSTFTETVTVANHGPWPAASVSTGITIPRGLTLTADPGGTKAGPVVYWTASSIGVNSSVTYTITVQVSASARGTVLFAAASASLKVPDPRPLNNAALTTVKLG